ncbi:MAG: hypothetical protein BWY59_00066 [Verrucomicrobia bacterium ADurb.Bin345]|nr:MAG: hypothetical protein BWY59_00066 [Verrucomicrobia bacterium ADurb.Bin345]
MLYRVSAKNQKNPSSPSPRTHGIARVPFKFICVLPSMPETGCPRSLLYSVGGRHSSSWNSRFTSVTAKRLPRWE